MLRPDVARRAPRNRRPLLAPRTSFATALRRARCHLEPLASATQGIGGPRPTAGWPRTPNGAAGARARALFAPLGQHRQKATTADYRAWGRGKGQKRHWPVAGSSLACGRAWEGLASFGRAFPWPHVQRAQSVRPREPRGRGRKGVRHAERLRQGSRRGCSRADVAKYTAGRIDLCVGDRLGCRRLFWAQVMKPSSL
jgi:hypothetical protein